MLKPPDFPALAALLLLFACTAFAEDRVGGFAPLEEQFKDNAGFPATITENELRNLELSDPKLRVAYYWLMKGATGGVEIVDKRYPGLVEVAKDLRRRGDATAPLWLDIMAKNQGSYLEYRIPLILAEAGGVNMQPYVDYLREMIETRWDTISGGACGIALDIFYQYGTRDDVELVLDLAKKRPFLAPYVRTVIEQKERDKRHNIQKSTPEAGPAQASPEDPPALAAEKVAEKKRENVIREKGGLISFPWIAIAAVISLAGIGLFWFLRNGRK